MRIILLTMHFSPRQGGIATYCRQLSCGLQSKGCTVYPHVTGKSKVLHYAYTLLVSLYRCWFQDIDHVLAAGWYPCGALGWLCFRLSGVPYTVISFGSELNFKYPLPVSSLKRRLRKIFKVPVFCSAHGHIAISDFTAAMLKSIEGMDHERVVTILPGVDTGFFTPGPPEIKGLQKLRLAGKRYMLSVGRLVPNKGFDSVIRVMPEILQEIPELMYCAAGEGPDRERLQEMITAFGLSKSVVLAGNLSTEELRNLYRGCDFFILPSRLDTQKGSIEGFGLVILEANACERVAIGSTSGGIPEAILEGETGFLFNENSKGELQNLLIKTLRNLSGRDFMKKNARQWAENNDWSLVASRFLDRLSCHD